MAGLITLQGNVVNEKDKKALAGIKVIATREGTKITQETDKNGKYLLNLTPGYWRISTWASGYQEPDAFYHNYTANTSGIDFELREGYSISGLVISQTDSKPISGAIVSAEAKADGEKKQALTNYYGKYCLNNLKPGNWSVQWEQGEYKTLKKSIKLDSDIYNLNLTLAREMTRKDRRCGIAFFLVLILLLGGLIWGYFAAHQAYSSPEEPELLVFSDQLGQVLDVADEAIPVQQAAGDTEADSGADTAMQRLRSVTTSLKEGWVSISPGVITISGGQKGQILILINRAETAAANDDPQDVKLSVNAIQKVIEDKRSIYLWSEPPMTYLEVLFWSLAGILISVFISSGYYLRKNRFYAEGIWMHVSHILTMPILSLVVVFLISMIKLSLQIEGSEVVLDINDPRLLVAISFIIAVRPWDIVSFVRDTGGLFFKKIKGSFSGDDDA